MDLYNYAPKAAFRQRHMLTLADYTGDEILQLLSTALDIKKRHKAGEKCDILAGKALVMLFAKQSLRTRLSFETGIRQLGGYPVVMSCQEIGLGIRETVSDVAKVISRMADGIMIRTYDQAHAEGLAEHGSVPVINALTDDYHPCQVLADFLTVYERKNTLEGLKLAFVGDGNNMANSLLFGCAKVGMDVAIASPEGYQPDKKFAERAKGFASVSGSGITITADPREAVSGADIVYTDVWTSMGQEAEREARMKAFKGYCVDESLFSQAKPDAMFLHCLPAHRGEEVSAGVIDGERSFVFDEAENRLHAQKAVMAMLMRD